MDKLFRYILVITTIAYMVSWSLPYVEHLWRSEIELDFISYDTWGSQIPGQYFVSWSVFLLFVLASLGMFFYVRIARTVFVSLHCAMFIATFFWGFRVSAPESAALIDLVSNLDGAVIAMSYLTSVSHRFEKKT